MFAEESLETRLICTQETGEIPPQESDSAANWLGMLRPVFVTACCFRCLGKHPLSLAEHLCKCSLRCRCSAQTPFLLHIGGINPYAVSCLSFPYSKSPLNSVSDAHCPFFLFFIPPPPKCFGLSAGKTQRINLCAQPRTSHPSLYKGALPNRCRSHPAKSSTTCRLLTGVIAQHCPAANAPQIPHLLQASRQKND